MSPNLRIAARFLVARKRAMAMSLAGIVFGVGLFIVTQAQTTGFENLFIRTVLGTEGAIRIEDKWQDTFRSLAASDMGIDSSFAVANRESRLFIQGVEEPRLVRDALAQFRNVAAVSEVVRGNVTIRSALRDDSAQVFGIDLAGHLAVSNLAQQIAFGELADFRAQATGILLGSAMAERLQVSLGETVVLEAKGETRRYVVSAIFTTGVSEIDKRRVFLHTSEARSLLQRPFGISFMQVSLIDVGRAPEDAARMEQVLQHSVVPWQKRERVWLGVFRALRVSSAITMSSIILVSGLGMFNTLAMVVMEKTREISILRSMGYTRRDIARIFLWQGGLVLAAGTVLGWIVGALVTWAVSEVPMPITGIFATDRFVVDWSPAHYAAATGTAFLIVMTASLVPARRAARLEPGDVIRGTAT
jgi:lipoprotein-releasing system permease protein